MNLRATQATTLIALSIITGCASQGSYDSEHNVPFSDDPASSTQPLWANTMQLWTTHSVDVCWETATLPPQQERDWVRDAIARTWPFAGDLAFTGWGPCPATSSGLRIKLIDDVYGPRVSGGFGQELAGRSGGLLLDHTFNNFQISPSTPGCSFVITCDSTSTPLQRRECIENIAVHEFGHVLGFHHEQNAPGASSEPDFPAGCEYLVNMDNADELYDNDWDLSSVMNYCSPAYGGPRLSALDFRGMQHFYGTSPRFVAALVGANVI